MAMQHSGSFVQMEDIQKSCRGLEQPEDSLFESESFDETLQAALKALQACINETGRVDLSWMQEFSGLDFSLLKEKLQGSRIVQDPLKVDPNQPEETGWVLKEAWLNGNLALKARQLEEAAQKESDRYQINRQVLQENMPVRVPVQQISLSLGAPWIPEKLYTDFIEELLVAYQEIPVHFIPELQVWKINARDEDVSYVENIYTYGTDEMSALKIITQTMNAKTVKVYDRRLDPYTGQMKQILNKARTLEAQEKQKKIIQAFELWCLSDLHRMDALEKAYNDAFVSWKGCAFDGSLLELPGLNPEISLYPHQKDAVAKVIFSEANVLLAHEVGTGKTFEIICAAHELIRLKKAAKIMVTMPNNVFQDIVSAHEQLYPQDQILSVSPRNFTKSRRKDVLAQIQAMKEGVIYLPYSCFDLIKMSFRHTFEKERQEILSLKKAKEKQKDRSVRDALDRKVHSQADKLSRKNAARPAAEFPGFDQLGIDVLFVDEAHNYKNIPLNYKADNIVGMHSAGSAKCRLMLEKCRCVSKVIFATGTPLTNSIADLFVLQTYLQPEALKENAIDAFDQWINTFARRETNFEIDVDAAGLRVMTRFSTFHNLNELMAMFSVCSDFHNQDLKNAAIPDFEGYTDLTVQKSPTQAEYIEQLAVRTEKIRTQRVSRQEDNLLLVTTDGRKCALDVRLVGLKPKAEEIASSKVSVCADQILKIAGENPGTAQLVFSDIGTPKAGFNIYDELKKQLVLRGMKPEEIAFIHDAKNEEERAEIFSRVNQAQVRVMIGSTQKLGTGVNVQERLVALHHLSVPWRPADMVQREGRILRQGNTCKKVSIVRYITQGSFDAYSWQLLESKQRFISSFLSGTNKDRSMEDIADSVLSYADVKALAIGNPLIKKRVETGNRLERARTSWQQRNNQLANLKKELKELPERIRQTEHHIDLIRMDMEDYAKQSGPITAADREKLGMLIAEAFTIHIFEPEEKCIAKYRGFEISIPKYLKPGERKIIFCAGKGRLQYPLPVRSDKPAGISRSLDYLLSHLPDELKRRSETIAKYEKDIERAHKELQAGNPYEAAFRQLQAELETIDAQIEEQAREEEQKKQLELENEADRYSQDEHFLDDEEEIPGYEIATSWIASDSDDYEPE